VGAAVIASVHTTAASSTRVALARERDIVHLQQAGRTTRAIHPGPTTAIYLSPPPSSLANSLTSLHQADRTCPSFGDLIFKRTCVRLILPLSLMARTRGAFPCIRLVCAPHPRGLLPQLATEGALVVTTKRRMGSRVKRAQISFCSSQRPHPRQTQLLGLACIRRQHRHQRIWPCPLQ
jgi:hypothetical protein